MPIAIEKDIVGDPSPSRITFVNVTVYNTTAPTTFTDLDISSVVGKRRTVALLRVINGTAVAVDVGIMDKGGGGSFYRSGASGASFPASVNAANIVIVITDTAGVLSWCASVANTIQIAVIAYW